MLSLFASKKDGTHVIGRGFGEMIRENNVLVVDDVLNTGGSLKTVVDLARQAGGNVLAAAAIFNRGNVTAEMIGVPLLVSLTLSDMPTYDEGNCSLCAKGVPINQKFGHYEEFVKRQAKQS